MSDAGVRTDVARPRRGDGVVARRARARAARRESGRHASSTAAAACSRRASSTRTRTPSSAARATRSRSCAPPASTTWRSRGAAAASTPPCATCATRSEDELFALAAPRLDAARRVRRHDGRGEVGLRPLARRRAQDAARRSRRLADALPLRIVPTFLGAHEIPLEHRERANGRREYIDRSFTR